MAHGDLRFALFFFFWKGEGVVGVQAPAPPPLSWVLYYMGSERPRGCLLASSFAYY